MMVIMREIETMDHKEKVVRASVNTYVKSVTPEKDKWGNTSRIDWN